MPYSSSRGRHAAPPDATTSVGCVPMNQLQTSILCRCCSTIWSPRDPHERIPVAVLELHVAPLGIALVIGEHRAVEVQHRRADPVGVHGDDVAQFAALQALQFVEVPGLRAPLRARFHGELQLFGLFRGGHEPPQVHRIGAKRLLAEDVLLRFDGRLEVHRAVGRVRGQHDDVHGLDDFLISVETDEVVFGIDLDAVGELRLESFGLPETVFQTVFENVGQRDDLDIVGAHQNVLNGLRCHGRRNRRARLSTSRFPRLAPVPASRSETRWRRRRRTSKTICGIQSCFP